LNGLRQFPLGDTIAGHPHSVCVSLPTRADVVGYEEKNPSVLGSLQTGYPRFVEHPLVRQLGAWCRRTLGLGEGTLLLCAGERVASEVVAFAGGGTVLSPELGPMRIVLFPAGDEASARRGRAFLQHTGGQVSSREAEAWLVALGELPAAFPELRARAGEEAELKAELAVAVGTDPDALYLTRGGMNAFYAAFRAIREHQAAEGRHRWVQLGWLYVDTMCLLRELAAPGFSPILWSAVEDTAGLVKRLRPFADEIAAIVVEAPTNPMFGLPDLPALRRLADELGALLLVDPSLVSLWNAPVLPWADVLVASLTKYAAPSGDVMAGLLAINPAGPHADWLKRAVEPWVTPLHEADQSRLAADFPAHRGLLQTVNRSLPEVARFLREHSRVERVWWAGETSGEGWLKGPGAVLSFTVRGDAAGFYDRLTMAKGPSFGTAFSLLSPYVWLAHFELTRSAGGRGQLAAAGVPADLMRLSVGTEPVGEIVRALDRALAGG
jgi:cystathionine gamma-synthase